MYIWNRSSFKLLYRKLICSNIYLAKWAWIGKRIVIKMCSIVCNISIYDSYPIHNVCKLISNIVNGFWFSTVTWPLLSKIPHSEIWMICLYVILNRNIQCTVFYTIYREAKCFCMQWLFRPVVYEFLLISISFHKSENA